jgi:hypothetical protein
MLTGIIHEGKKSLVDFDINVAALPTKQKLEYFSRQDVVLKKIINLTLGGKEGLVEIKAILD